MKLCVLTSSFIGKLLLKSLSAPKVDLGDLLVLGMISLSSLSGSRSKDKDSIRFKLDLIHLLRLEGRIQMSRDQLFKDFISIMNKSRIKRINNNYCKRNLN